MLRDFGDGAPALRGQRLVAGRGAAAGGLQRAAGTKARQAAGEGSLKLLPEFALVGRQDSHERDAAGRGLGPRGTHAAAAKLPVRGRREGWSWDGESPRATLSLPGRVRTEAPEQVPKEKANLNRIP